MPLPQLQIARLDRRHPGVNAHAAGYLHDAARVCLHRHHSSPTQVDIRHDAGAIKAEVQWSLPDAGCLASHANVDDATRDGAYACVIAAVELTDELIAIGRAHTKTGADYYLAPPGSGTDDLEQAIRLEVSGVNAGPEHEVAARLNRKLAQLRQGQGALPAIAGVIGFRERLVLLRKAV